MEIAASKGSFAALDLSAETLASLEAKGYAAPTEVQAETIPRAMTGRDLVVQSRTGTGNTAAFGIPMVAKVAVRRELMEHMPADRQPPPFPATVPLGIRCLIYHYLADPEWVLLSEDQIYVKDVHHLYCLTPNLHKEATLYKLLEYENPASSMVF